MPERATRQRCEKSAEVVVAGNGEGPNGEESETSVHLGGKGPQMSRQLELPLSIMGETPSGKRSEEALSATPANGGSGASERTDGTGV